jgi:hypothetical protein
MSDLVPTYRADVLIRRVRADGTKVTVAVVRSDRRGLVRIELPPGRYVVSGTRIDTSTQRVVVTDGRVTAVKIQVANVY